MKRINGKERKRPSSRVSNDGVFSSCFGCRPRKKKLGVETPQTVGQAAEVHSATRRGSGAVLNPTWLSRLEEDTILVRVAQDTMSSAAGEAASFA